MSVFNKTPLRSLSRRHFVQGLAGSALLVSAARGFSRDSAHDALNHAMPDRGMWRGGASADTPSVLSGPEFHLTIGTTQVNYTGVARTATTVNGRVPGPLLRMRQGDAITIRVTNRLPSPTSIHWHGVIVPADMDGVPGLSFAGIAPGETFEYRFKVNQYGTYWYHAHSRFQEQEGLYGSIVIERRGGERHASDREHVILLSDWTDIDPEHLHATLKRDSSYFNFGKRTVGDFFADVRRKGWKETVADRRMWGQMRMDPTDLLDVSGYAYTYLMNGVTPSGNWTALFNRGERVRLRIINGSSMSFFDVRIPGLKMTVVAADGQDIEPVTVDEFRIGAAEVYDVIVEPSDDRAYTIFAQAMDRSGYARGTLAPRAGMSAEVPAMDPRPLLTMSDMGMAHGAGHDMAGMEGMKGMEGMEGMDHSMKHAAISHAATESSPIVDMQVERAAPRLDDPGVGLRDNGRRVLTYADLHTLGGPIDRRPAGREIELHLTGHMERFIWSFNGQKFSEAEPLRFTHGERLRIVLVNDSMMNHPIHLHGMWSELEDESGAFLVRKHTVTVQPAQRMSYLVTADALGRWAYHCHLLYHMEAGMFREVVVAHERKPGGAPLMSAALRSIVVAVAAAVLLMPIAGAQEHKHDMPQPASGPTESEQEHVPPEPPTAQDTHPMPYRAMARMMGMDDTSATSMVMLDRLEWRDAGGGSAFAWNAHAWYGNDYNKLWLKAEGERENGSTTAARTEVLWDRIVARWWNLQAGARHDSGFGAARNWAALGVQGLAPGFFNVEATAYLGDSGRAAARISAERDLLFTQRLVLQPEFEVNLYSKDDPQRHIGSGLSDLELALRLRYEVRREFATYLGVVWARRIGDTATLVRAAGEDPNDVQLLAGLHIWF